MTALIILGTQEIIMLLIVLVPLSFVVIIPVVTYRAGLRKGREEARLAQSVKTRS